MHKYLILLVYLLLPIKAKIDMFLGAGGLGFGCGSNSPAVQLPYSYLRLGPDTTPLQNILYKNFQHYGGYSTADHAVKAFSHMHLVGAGVIDLGVLGVLPTISSNEDKVPKIPDNIKMRFDKSREYAQPGYYSSQLYQRIQVQLTTTQRSGYHRYFYSNLQNKPMDVYIMSSYLLQQKAKRFAQTKKCGKTCLEGSIWNSGSFGSRFGGFTAYFHLEWISNHQNETIYFYDSSGIVNTEKSEGNYSGAILRTKSNKLEIKVGISYVSIENARENLEKEIGNKTFDQIKEQAREIWRKQLDRFDFIAISNQLQTKIDTAIYRTLLTPTLFNDWNGQYPSFKNDGSISVVPEEMNNVYTDMSIWDVHRTQMPWIQLHDPHRFHDIAMSIVLINRDGGYMPKWPFAQGPTGCMIGAHANTILSDWIIKQGQTQETRQIFNYMLRNANNHTISDSRADPISYKELGYLSVQKVGSSRSGSETLEYSYDDFGISQIAGLLGENQIQKDFVNRSKFYKNVWNKKTKFFEPRFKNGTFKHISVMERTNILSKNYVQGDAWHYRFYAPHDAEGLIELFGGKKPFTQELQIFFKRSTAWPILWLPNPYYWAGNQHNLFSVWLFPFADRPDLTQKYSRLIISTFYGTEGNGLPGNDDYATMSAWLVFACMGFYPLPSTQNYILGSPMIHYGRISRKISEDSIKSFKIRVSNNSNRNMHVDKVQLNGNEIKKFLNHKLIREDAYVEFKMKK